MRRKGARWLLVGMAGLALTSCGHGATMGNTGTSASGGTTKSADHDYGPEDPRNPSFWQGANKSVASDFDIAGVKLGMTIEQAVTALQANGFKPFSKSPSPPKDNETLPDSMDGYSLQATSKTYPSITMEVDFWGSPDASAKWGMGEAMQAGRVTYDQKLGDADQDNTMRAVNTLVAKAASKYGHDNELLLQPIAEDEADLAIWGSDASRNVYSSHSNQEMYHFADRITEEIYFRGISSPLDAVDKRTADCKGVGQGDYAIVPDSVPDSMVKCLEAAWKEKHAMAKQLSPILVAGYDVTNSAFGIDLFSPYRYELSDISEDRKRILPVNREWDKRQSTAEAAVGNTAF